MGGHLTHGRPRRPPASGSIPSSTGSATTPAGSTWTRLATWRLKSKPKIIFCGGTAIPRIIDFPAFAAIAAEAGALPVADIAHIAGLVAAGVMRNPLDYGFDIVTTTTHKTLRGPRGAMIMSKSRACVRRGQGGVPRPAGRPAQPHHRRRSRWRCTRRSSRSSRTTPTRC